MSINYLIKTIIIQGDPPINFGFYGGNTIVLVDPISDIFYSWKYVCFITKNYEFLIKNSLQFVQRTNGYQVLLKCISSFIISREALVQSEQWGL